MAAAQAVGWTAVGEQWPVVQDVQAERLGVREYTLRVPDIARHLLPEQRGERSGAFAGARRARAAAVAEEGGEALGPV